MPDHSFAYSLLNDSLLDENQQIAPSQPQRCTARGEGVFFISKPYAVQESQVRSSRIVEKVFEQNEQNASMFKQKETRDGELVNQSDGSAEDYLAQSGLQGNANSAEGRNVCALDADGYPNRRSGMIWIHVAAELCTAKTWEMMTIPCQTWGKMMLPCQRIQIYQYVHWKRIDETRFWHYLLQWKRKLADYVNTLARCLAKRP